METITSLEKIRFDQLYESFSEAFSTYEVQVNKEELNIMLIRRGYVPDLSFGAFDNNKLIAFTLNGIGNFNGVKTAYDTGTGTLKEYQGKGIASKIFNYSLPHLKNAGISHYLLEVLQHNGKAVSVYNKLGFITTRELNYFKQDNDKVELNSTVLPSLYTMQDITLDSKEQLISFWNFVPSWQNSFEAIERRPGDFIIKGVYKELKLIGYCVFEPTSGDITQIAVDKQYRRQRIASALLKEVLKFNKCNSVKAINTEITCNEITTFLLSNCIYLRGKQFEMIKKL